MRLFLGALVCSLILLPSTARADFQYALAFTVDGSAAAPVSGGIGGQVVVPVYLVETGTQGAGPNGLGTVAPNTQNLFGSSFSVSYSTPGVAAASTLAENAAFNPILTINSPPTFSAGQFLGQPGAAGSAFATNGGGTSVKIGDLTIDLVAAGNTTITLGTAVNPNYTLNTPGSFGTSISGNASSFGSLSVSVPEPSSAIALLAVGSCFAFRRRRSA